MGFKVFKQRLGRRASCCYPQSIPGQLAGVPRQGHAGCVQEQRGARAPAEGRAGAGRGEAQADRAGAVGHCKDSDLKAGEVGNSRIPSKGFHTLHFLCLALLFSQYLSPNPSGSHM